MDLFFFGMMATTDAGSNCTDWSRFGDCELLSERLVLLLDEHPPSLWAWSSNCRMHSLTG